MNLERSVIEVKLAPSANASADLMEFSGYGAVFGNVDSYGDVIAPGAFANSLAEIRSSGRWPTMLAQHGGGMFGSAADMTPIGVWTNMSEDGVGLKVEGRLAPTDRGREHWQLMKMEPRPAIDGLSIGYRVKQAQQRTKPDEPRRTLQAVDLVEVSLVTFPANAKARVLQVKGLLDMSEREFGRWLTREAGLSRSQADALMRSGWSGLSAQRDAGDETDAEAEAAALRAANRLLQSLRA